MNINFRQSFPWEVNALSETVYEPYFNHFQDLFPAETDLIFIEKKLSLIACLPNLPEKDLARLNHFIELKNTAKCYEQKKFYIELIADHGNQCWRFKFTIYGQSLYESELQPIGDGQVLAEYEKPILLSFA